MAFRSPSIVGIPSLQAELLEKVVALVIDEDEGREVLDSDLPDRLHAKLRVLYAFDAPPSRTGRIPSPTRR